MNDIEDISRPKGSQSASSRHKVHAGGIEYEVDHMVEAGFGLTEHKQDVYANCVRAIIGDLIKMSGNQ